MRTQRGTLPPDRPTRGLLPEWDAFELHDQLIRALHHQSFTKPTPIQLESPSSCLARERCRGCSRNGACLPSSTSNKHLHSHRDRGKLWRMDYLSCTSSSHGESYPASKTRRPVRALILAPTRELALQISSHLNACLNDVDA
jgi:ATP-dependent RNA helicase DDX24/MAK5